jgi:hypothetical protein
MIRYGAFISTVNSSIQTLTYIELSLTDLGTLSDILLERITDSDFLHSFSKLGEELVIDPFLHEHPRTSATCLTVIPAIENHAMSMALERHR